MTLLMAILLPLVQGGEGKPSDGAVPKKVEDPDLLQEGVRLYEIPPVKRVSLEGKDLSTGVVVSGGNVDETIYQGILRKKW